MVNADKTSECCPRFNPTLWDGKMLHWHDKKFIKDKVFTLFYIPINFGSVIKRMTAKMDKVGAESKEWMSLADHTSKWNMDLYIAVDKKVPGAKNVTLTGKFFSKVYEGDFRKTGEWCKDFKCYAEKEGMKVKKMYMWYTTCPKCAKKYGKNYVVIVGEV